MYGHDRWQQYQRDIAYIESQTRPRLGSLGYYIGSLGSLGPEAQPVDKVWQTTLRDAAIHATFAHSAA